MNRVLAFSQSVFGSSWLNTATQYYDARQDHVGNSTAAYGGSAIDLTDPSLAPSVADLVNEAAKYATSVGDFSIDANYVILTPHGVVPSVTFADSACAYHTAFTNNSSINVPFTVLPYQPDDAGCGANSVNAGSTGLLDGVSEALGHEQAEPKRIRSRVPGTTRATRKSPISAKPRPLGATGDTKIIRLLADSQLNLCGAMRQRVAFNPISLGRPQRARPKRSPSASRSWMRVAGGRASMIFAP
jgi:hypothetical protein